MERNASPLNPPGQESVGSLLSGLLGDLQNLIRGEVDLAKTEVREEAEAAKGGLVMFGAAAALGLTGLIVFMLGVAVYLERWLDTWQALGLVGVVLIVVAALAGMAGKRRMPEHPIPDRTLESLKEDKQWASRQVKSVKS